MKNLDPGLVVIIVVVVVFYMRLYMIRGQRKKLQRQLALQAASDRPKGKKRSLPQKDRNQPAFSVTSWWIVGIAIVFMLLALAMKTSGLFPSPYKEYYWIPFAIGGIMFIFGWK
jgi:cytochrome c biogenesis protein CcdA